MRKLWSKHKASKFFSFLTRIDTLFVFTNKKGLTYICASWCSLFPLLWRELWSWLHKGSCGSRCSYTYAVVVLSYSDMQQADGAADVGGRAVLTYEVQSTRPLSDMEKLGRRHSRLCFEGVTKLVRRVVRAHRYRLYLLNILTILGLRKSDKKGSRREIFLVSWTVA